MKNKATITEILHTKSPEKFAALIAQLIRARLISPEAAAGDSWFGPAKETAPPPVTGQENSDISEARDAA